MVEIDLSTFNIFRFSSLEQHSRVSGVCETCYPTPLHNIFQYGILDTNSVCVCMSLYIHKCVYIPDVDWVQYTQHSLCTSITLALYLLYIYMYVTWIARRRCAKMYVLYFKIKGEITLYMCVDIPGNERQRKP